MWALVKEKPEEGLWMKRVPIPEVGPNDVKIKIHKTAICGTDVHICLLYTSSAAGMRDAVKKLAPLAVKLAKGEKIGSSAEEGYIPNGVRVNFFRCV